MRGEEVTVSYSEDYFRPGNVDCKCPSCASKKTIKVAAQLRPPAAATQEEDQLPLPNELMLPLKIHREVQRPSPQAQCPMGLLLFCQAPLQLLPKIRNASASHDLPL